jgi:gliding motility-associated-like protein
MRVALKHLILFCLLICSAISRATHNRAGEITYRRIEPFTKIVGGMVVPEYRYLITVTKYTDDGDGIADRCVDTVYFGDGERGIAPRVNGIPVTQADKCGCGNMNGVPVGCGELIINESNQYKVKLNTYTITHTYAGPGNYLIRSFDPNRNQGVRNIPNSVNLPFYIESLLIINSFTGANSSPVFQYAPIDRACVNKCFQHNPGAFDADNDSLSFELSAPRGVNGAIITGYFLPEIQSGGTFKIGSSDGLLTWCNPQLQDEYNIAFVVKEWRKNTNGDYQLIGFVLRDMQVIVGSCPFNDPPIIDIPPDTCVEAGTLITRMFRVTDPNSGNTVTLEGKGGPFSGPLPVATLANTQAVITNTSEGFMAKFTWQTNCNHIRKFPYQATFKALDNGVPVKLPVFGSYNIRVVPPTVKNVTAVPMGSNMKITWDVPGCLPSANPLVGFSIFRRNDCSTLAINPCQTGAPPSSGFTLAGETKPLTTMFIDDGAGDGLIVGQHYSYIVVANYFDGSQSFASTSVCSKLKRDVPVILNVDVAATSSAEGMVEVRWTRPLKTAGNLDTVAFPGPYRFVLKHKTGGDYTPVFTSEKAFLYQLDTFFVHGGLNTAEQQHEYIVEFTAGTVTIGTSQRANSLLLSATPNDRRIDVSWSAHTPWRNYRYTVYRKTPGASTFSLLAVTDATSYSDTNLVVNRQTYCYYVRSEGEYSDPAIYKPLLNRSQQLCVTAIDKVPPCAPSLTIDADCPTGFVQVSWNNIRDQKCGDDVIRYVLYFKPTLDDVYTEVSSGTQLSYVYDGLTLISGCYAVQAIDSSDNKSALGTDHCIDNCPEFELPNLFTPNGDGANDFFQAIKIRQVKEIELKIVDRWGIEVFRTRDPYFKWDGISALTKKLVSEGTFFFVCDVYEPRLTGIVRRTIKGYVQVAR